MTPRKTGLPSIGQPKLLYARRDAAATISISLRWLDQLIRDNRIAIIRKGGRVLISHEALMRYAASNDSRPLVPKKVLRVSKADPNQNSPERPGRSQLTCFLYAGNAAPKVPMETLHVDGGSGDVTRYRQAQACYAGKRPFLMIGSALKDLTPMREGTPPRM